MLTLIEGYHGLAPGTYGLSVLFTGQSDYIMLQAGYKEISVAIHPAVGQTARVEFTLAGKDDVDGGTAAWLTWPLGNVSASSDDAMLTHAYALRGVSSGSARIEVLAK